MLLDELPHSIGFGNVRSRFVVGGVRIVHRSRSLDSLDAGFAARVLSDMLNDERLEGQVRDRGTGPTGQVGPARPEEAREGREGAEVAPGPDGEFTTRRRTGTGEWLLA